MTMTRSTIWLGVIVSGTVVAGAAGWALRSRPELQVETAPVTDGPITRRIVATGTVQPVTTVAVGAQVSGIVQSLNVDFDSIVRAGQVIARLDPSLYQAALDEARGNLQQAQAALGQAEANLAGFRTAEADARTRLARARELAAGRLIPAADLDAAEIALNQASADVHAGQAQVNDARAAIDQARAGVDQASANLAHTVILSPIDGIVIDREFDVGQTVAAAIQAPLLFRIAAPLAHVQVQVDIDESDVDGLTPGEPATFEVEAFPEEMFRGTVRQLRLQPVAEQTATSTPVASSTATPASTVVATVVSYAGIIDVDNPDQRLRPGMTASVVLDGARRERAIRIPNGAIAFRPTPEALQMLGETEPSVVDAARASNGNTQSRNVWEYDGRQFTPIAVHVGLADSQWTELLSGPVRPGNALVTSAVLRQRPRMPGL
jgi:HlyD family secretion protein